MFDYGSRRRDSHGRHPQPGDAATTCPRIAVAIGFRMNLFNIGVDGQYRLAALLAAVVGGALHAARAAARSR